MVNFSKSTTKVKSPSVGEITISFPFRVHFIGSKTLTKKPLKVLTLVVLVSLEIFTKWVRVMDSESLSSEIYCAKSLIPNSLNRNVFKASGLLTLKVCLERPFFWMMFSEIKVSHNSPFNLLDGKVSPLRSLKSFSAFDIDNLLIICWLNVRQKFCWNHLAAKYMYIGNQVDWLG